VATPRAGRRRGRNRVPEGHGDSDPRGLQHARQSIRIQRALGARRNAEGARGGRALHRLQSDERRLPSQSPRDGRRAAGRNAAPVARARTRAGVQCGAADDAPAGLPRPPARPPLLPACRALTAGGSSLREVQRLLSVLAAGRRCAETGTAFGEGAVAIVSTATSLVTVESDPTRACDRRVEAGLGPAAPAIRRTPWLLRTSRPARSSAPPSPP